MAVQEFLSTTSLSEAQQAISDGAASSWLAGGTDLLVGIRLGARDPTRVDLKKIPELTAIEIDDASVRIGAAASAFDVLHNSDVPTLFPGLAEALDLIGSTQITGRCSTAGGNLCNASPAADSIPALIANGAQCRIMGPDGERTLRLRISWWGQTRMHWRPANYWSSSFCRSPRLALLMLTCGSHRVPKWTLQ